jgi:L-lactate dehydrogenase complex protein LldG
MVQAEPAEEPGARIMSSRDDILAAVRAHAPKLDRKLPVVPLFDAATPADPVSAFIKMLEKMGGEWLAADPADPLAPVREKLAGAKTICSNVPEIAGNRPIEPGMRPADLADVDYGIVRAAFAVAETGSLCLTDCDLGINTLGYLPQRLIVLLDPADIVPNIHHAYRRPQWRQANYAVFQTGPSATADIEGVLIHGAQGVRSLSVLALKRGGVACPAPAAPPS